MSLPGSAAVVIFLLVQCVMPQCLARRTNSEVANLIESEAEEEEDTILKPPPMLEQLDLVFARAENNPRGVNIIGINDPGQDLDDELAFLMMKQLSEQDLINVLGIVVTLAPEEQRTSFTRRTLDRLGMNDVLVAQGSSGEFKAAGDDVLRKRLELLESEEREGPVREEGIVRGTNEELGSTRLLVALYTKALEKKQKVTLVVMGSCADVYVFASGYPSLFRAVTERVVIQGGAAGIQFQRSNFAKNGSTDINFENGNSKTVVDAAQKAGEKYYVVGDTSNNIKFDPEKSQALIRAVQRFQIPLVFVSRFAAYGAAIKKEVYKTLGETQGELQGMGKRIAKKGKEGIRHLWEMVNKKEDDETALPTFPKRCTRAWFFKTFCKQVDGSPGIDPGREVITYPGSGKEALREGVKKRKGNNDIWEYVTHLNQYDTLATIASVPQFLSGGSALFKPVVLKKSYTGDNAVYLVGETEEKSDVVDRNQLENFMVESFKAALR